MSEPTETQRAQQPVSSYTATFFVTPLTRLRSSAFPHPVLYIEPDGEYGRGRIVFQAPSDVDAESALEVAERFASAAIGWRDALAEHVAAERTAKDELAEAREEIARLKAEAEVSA